jgi:hypothetical protein
VVTARRADTRISGQQPMGYPQQGQTYVVQDGNRGNAGMGAGAGILGEWLLLGWRYHTVIISGMGVPRKERGADDGLAGLCAALLCFDLGACLC